VGRLIAPLAAHRFGIIVGIGRDVDEAVQRLITDEEVERRHLMARARQSLRQHLEVALLKQHRLSVLDGALVVQVVELSGVHGHAAGLQGRHGVLDEAQALVNRPQVLEGAERPTEVVVAQVAGDRVHVDGAVLHTSVEQVVAHQMLVEGLVPLADMLVGALPSRARPVFGRKVRHRQARPLRRQEAGDGLAAAAETQAAAALLQHAGLIQGLQQIEVFPDLAVVDQRALQRPQPGRGPIAVQVSLRRGLAAEPHDTGRRRRDFAPFREQLARQVVTLELEVQGDGIDPLSKGRRDSALHRVERRHRDFHRSPADALEGIADHARAQGFGRGAPRRA